MKSLTTPDFWASFLRLPTDVKARAKVTYQLWRKNPRHPSLCFKKVKHVWSVRIHGGYRALAVLEGDTFYWFWIGDHKSYSKLIGRL